MNSPKTIERSTSGIRDLMFSKAEQFMRGEVDSEHIKSLESTFTVILKTVQVDLQALKMAADQRRERGGPREVADLHLNLKLGGSVSAGIASIADQPDHVTDVTPKPSTGPRFLRKSGMQKPAANQNGSASRKQNRG